MFVSEMLPTALRRLATIRDDARLIDAARLLTHSHVNLVMVCDCSGALSGVSHQYGRRPPDQQLRRPGLHDRGRGGHDSRGDFTAVAPTLSSDVWSTMRKRGLKYVPVTDRDSKPLGVLYVRDVLEVLLREVEYEELLLRDYVMGVGYR